MPGSESAKDGNQGNRSSCRPFNTSRQVAQIMSKIRLALLLLLAPLSSLGAEPPTAAAETGANTVPSSREARKVGKQQLDPHIKRITKQYKVEPALVHAVIKAESNYNAHAVSPAGAIGLMQLMPATAQDYGVDDPESLFDPVINITAGIRHLSRLLRKYRNISHALAAYNAGEGAVARYRRSVTYLETRKYVVRVINTYWSMKGGRINITIPVKR
jgi:soluble lytic murein transglycosylase-like protein